MISTQAPRTSTPPSVHPPRPDFTVLPSTVISKERLTAAYPYAIFQYGGDHATSKIIAPYIASLDYANQFAATPALIAAVELALTVLKTPAWRILGFANSKVISKLEAALAEARGER